MDNNRFLVDPCRLVERAESVKGYQEFLSPLNGFIVFSRAFDVVEEWSADWSEGEGFGSSDFSFMIQDLLRQLIYERKLQDYVEVGFFPRLEIREKRPQPKDAEQKHFDNLATYNERFND